MMRMRIVHALKSILVVDLIAYGIVDGVPGVKTQPLDTEQSDVTHVTLFQATSFNRVRAVGFLSPAISYIKIRSGSYFNVCDGR